MSILKVARMGHPVLVQVAVPVDPVELATPAFQTFIDDMLETMADEGGVGLAGPQVHRSSRLFVMQAPHPERGARSGPEPDLVVVNPTLTFPDEETIGLWEGCLSIPGIRGFTQRRRRVHLDALDREGRPFRLELEGFGAAVVQHETDHLDGILFFERIPDLSSLAFEDELARFSDEDDEEDEEGATDPEQPQG